MALNEKARTRAKAWDADAARRRGGLLLPAEFISVAEETGLIVPIGQWVLEEACRQVVAWRAELPDQAALMVSVYLSPRQFQQKNLVAQVARGLREAGLTPAWLKLEITEGVIMQDVEATIRTLWQLKELGVQLAIDDFGTGYSSLAYLKRLPLDILKIDRAFINGIGQDSEDTAIVRAIIAMAKSLNLSITGEGIETAEQAALLPEWACDKGQGYYFARPLSQAVLRGTAQACPNRRFDAGGLMARHAGRARNVIRHGLWPILRVARVAA